MLSSSQRENPDLFGIKRVGFLSTLLPRYVRGEVPPISGPGHVFLFIMYIPDSLQGCKFSEALRDVAPVISRLDFHTISTKSRFIIDSFKDVFQWSVGSGRNPW